MSVGSLESGLRPLDTKSALGIAFSNIQRSPPESGSLQGIGMGSVNTYALLVGLAAFAGWTVSCSTVTRRLGWVNWLGGVGILALFFSIASPDDDGFQQELIRPTPPSTTVSSHAKVAQRGSLVDLSINAFAAEGDPIRAFRPGRSVVMDQPLGQRTHFQAPISIHSPPIAS
jgi:hypothetical protein